MFSEVYFVFKETFWSQSIRCKEYLHELYFLHRVFLKNILSMTKKILTGFFMLSVVGVVTGWVRVGLWDCQPPSVCGVGVGQSFTNHCPSSCPLFFVDSLVILLTVPIFIWNSQEPQFFNLDTFHGNSSTPSTQIIKIPHNFQPCNVSCVTSIIWLSAIKTYFFVSSESNNSPWPLFEICCFHKGITRKWGWSGVSRRLWMVGSTFFPRLPRGVRACQDGLWYFFGAG